MTPDHERLLDEIGWRILHELQHDGRISFAEIGRRVGLTLPAVAERIRRMEDAGIIVGYHAEINPAKVGMPITAFIRISIVGDVSARIVAAVRKMPEVIECHRGTGADSFTLKVVVASVENLESVIDKLMPLGTTSTSIVLSSPVLRRTIERPSDGEISKAKRKKTAD